MCVLYSPVFVYLFLFASNRMHIVSTSSLAQMKEIVHPFELYQEGQGDGGFHRSNKQRHTPSRTPSHPQCGPHESDIPRPFDPQLQGEEGVHCTHTLCVPVCIVVCVCPLSATFCAPPHTHTSTHTCTPAVCTVQPHTSTHTCTPAVCTVPPWLHASHTRRSSVTPLWQLHPPRTPTLPRRSPLCTGTRKHLALGIAVIRLIHTHTRHLLSSALMTDNPNCPECNGAGWMTVTL